MRTPESYTQEDLDFILAHYKELTVPEMAFHLALEKTIIYNIASRLKLQFKPVGKEAPKLPKREYVSRKNPEPPKSRIQRPPAVYSNHSPFGIAS